jgi:hypothetical protein
VHISPEQFCVELFEQSPGTYCPLAVDELRGFVLLVDLFGTTATSPKNRVKGLRPLTLEAFAFFSAVTKPPSPQPQLPPGQIEHDFF